MADHRITAFETRHGTRCLDRLGPGVGQDGIVWLTDSPTAVKFVDRLDRYERERDVYRLLGRRNIRVVAGHFVPRALRFDDELRAIEMTLVTRPFLLDFAGAKLPREVPDFDPEIIEGHHRHLQDLFGDRWTDALHVAEAFRRETGYTLLDIHPGNIAFQD